MGSIVGKAMEDSMAKQQAAMAESQRLMLERNIQMQNYMREQMMAANMARARDLLHWVAAFYGVTFVGGVAGFRKTRKPMPLIPLVPLTFIVAYQWDLAYGNKMERIRAEADKILHEETGLIQLPTGLPTVQVLDDRRKLLK